MDDRRRALLSVDIRAALSQNSESVEVWIDTAFDGHFVFPEELIRQLKLEPLVETEAVLADGTTVQLQAYICYLNWFGEMIAAHVVESESRFPLLGTELLKGRRLTADYKSGIVNLE